MILKCKKSHRFLCKIDIESYVKNLKDIGIEQLVPLRVTVPCRICKEVEVYDIYLTHYTFIENISKNKNCMRTN